jgi:hypothetical protein
MSKHQEQIIAAARGKVGGEILGAAWGKPRGRRRRRSAAA